MARRYGNRSQRRKFGRYRAAHNRYANKYMNASFLMAPFSRRFYPVGGAPIVNRPGKALVMTKNTHYFSRWATGTFPVSNDATWTGGNDNFGAMSFKIQQVSNFTELTPIFDRYKIRGIKVQFECRQNIWYGYGTATPPVVTTVIDYDDDNPPTSQVELQERATCRIQQFSASRMIISRYFKPRVTGLVYKTPLTSGYSVVTPPYLDVNNPDIPHYGLKWNVSNVNIPSGTEGVPPMIS